MARTCHQITPIRTLQKFPVLPSKFRRRRRRRRRRHKMSKCTLPAVSWRPGRRQNYILEGSFQSPLCFIFRFSVVYIVVVLGAFTKLRMWLLASSSLPVRLSILMQQLGCYRTDFHAIWYLITFLNSIEKNQVSLKSDRNNVYFTWRHMNMYKNISLNFTFMWPCIVINFFTIKPTRCTNFTNLFWHETL